MINIEHLISFYPDNLKPFRKNILREYLQYKVLDIIYNSKYNRNLIFMGGTSIRIIHKNTRFSEDLDFDNKGISAQEFTELAEDIKKSLELEGYKPEIKVTKKGAYKCSLKFPGILFQTGISGHREAKLVIQIDTEPQNYEYEPQSELINKFEVFTSIFTVPVNLLLSQKIYAVFTRKRPMGRDFFDIVFLHGRAEPDMQYLSEKLGIKDRRELKERLLERCKNYDFRQLAGDIKNFIFNPNDSQKVTLFYDYVKSKF